MRTAWIICRLHSTKPEARWTPSRRRRERRLELPALRFRARAGCEDVPGGRSISVRAGADAAVSHLAVSDRTIVRLPLSGEPRLHERRVSAPGVDHMRHAGAVSVVPIVTFPDDRLTTECAEVIAGDHTGEWARNLIDTMLAKNGWGLAAPQIGILKRLFVVHVPGETREPIVMINPQWGIRLGDTQVLRQEGCLSFPGIQSEADRFDHVLAHWTDLEGRPHAERFNGWAARVIQHESDHLYGKLIVDQVTSVRRRKIEREMERWHEENGG